MDFSPVSECPLHPGEDVNRSKLCIVRDSQQGDGPLLEV